MNSNVRVRKAGVILILLSLLNLIGCSAIDKDTATQITTALQEKYGEEFEVTSIGNRLGTANNDSVTSYVHPKSNSSILFKATMDTKGKLISDNYIVRKIGNEIENIISTHFKNNSLNAQAIVYAYGADSSESVDTTIGLEEYIETYKPKIFIATIILEDSSDLNSASIIASYESIYKNLFGVGFQSDVKVISNKDYEEASLQLRKTTDVNETWFNHYKVVHSFILDVNEEGVSMSEPDLKTIIEGNK